MECPFHKYKDKTCIFTQKNIGDLVWTISQAIFQEIRQSYFPRVIRVKLAELIAYLQYIFLPNLSHLFELVNNILWFTARRIFKGKTESGCDYQAMNHKQNKENVDQNWE